MSKYGEIIEVKLNIPEKEKSSLTVLCHSENSGYHGRYYNQDKDKMVRFDSKAEAHYVMGDISQRTPYTIWPYEDNKFMVELNIKREGFSGRE